MTPTEFVPLIVVLTVLATGAFLWWARPDAAIDDESDVACDEDLHVLFDELTRAAEDDGVFDDDATLDPRLAHAADITPAIGASHDDLGALANTAVRFQSLPQSLPQFVAHHI